MKLGIGMQLLPSSLGMRSLMPPSTREVFPMRCHMNAVCMRVGAARVWGSHHQHQVVDHRDEADTQLDGVAEHDAPVLQRNRVQRLLPDGKRAACTMDRSSTFRAQPCRSRAHIHRCGAAEASPPQAAKRAGCRKE